MLTIGREQAVNALKKVERLLHVPAKGTRVIPPQDLGLFLKTYMLGIVTVINDLLRDVQGKKSVLSKRQILRSLGTFVVLMGPSITNVAPQVRSRCNLLDIAMSHAKAAFLLDYGDISNNGWNS